uniref:glutamate receptor ionotropic, kainate 2-like isoform X3 n=1 Tax=Ciona intestinalis TaxID=7719 RepID=UPI000EF4B2A5|nr:glutamate receptor ionotropic, kainate 2-like isoform X3 [Ciona intestinalis]|eukprot:XP_026694371.1 glutamate receptor ionotropic, kainate 2-like isoform X3 [Ciona intestinalis]
MTAESASRYVRTGFCSFLLFFVLLPFCMCEEATIAEIAVIYPAPRNLTFESSMQCVTQYINANILQNVTLRLQTNITTLEYDHTGVNAFKAGLALNKRSGVMGLLGPIHTNDVTVLHSQIAAMNIPQIVPISRVTTKSYMSHFPMLVKMTKGYMNQVSAMVDLILEMQWKTVGILIENSEYYRDISRNFYPSVRAANITVKFFISFNEVGIGVADTKEEMQTIKKSGQRVILLLTSDRLVNSVLDEAKNCGLTNSEWVWLLWADIVNTMKGMQSLEVQSGFALVQTFPSTNLSETLKTCEIPHNFVFRKYMDSLFAFAYGLKSLFSENRTSVKAPTAGIRWENGRLFLEHILSNHQYNEGIASHKIEFDVKTAEVLSTPTFDVVHLHNSSCQTVGNWSMTSRLSMNNQSKLTALKNNSFNLNNMLKNSKIRVITMNAPPFVMQEDENVANNTYTGYSFELFRKLQEDIGFTYEVLTMPSGVFGARDPLSGQWNGLIGQIVDGLADIAVGPFTLTAERSKAVDFTEVFYKTNLKYIIDIQAAGGMMSGYDRYGFLRPFTWTLWLVIAICVLVVGIFFTLVSHLSPYGAHGHYFQSDEAEAANIRMERRRSSVIGVSSSSLFRRRSSSIFPKQEKNENKQRDSVRIKKEESRDRSVGTISSSSVETLLKTSQYPIAEKLYDAILLDPRMPGYKYHTLQPNQEKALEQVRIGKLAFVWEGALLDHAALESDCHLKTVKLGFGPTSYAFVLKQGSPYREELSKHIKILAKNGYLDELNKKYFSQTCSHGLAEDDSNSVTAISWLSLIGVLDLLLLSAALSVIVLLFEWIVASISDIDKTNPRAPATFSRAFAARWRRMVQDAKRNWLPFKHARLHWNNKMGKKEVPVVNAIEPDQWKRYTTSTDAINLKPGQSISNPELFENDLQDSLRLHE